MTIDDPGALATAATWVLRILLGSLASMIAILGIAFIGFLGMQGRISARYGAKCILGIFILFSAEAIAQSLINTSAGGHLAPDSAPDVPASGPVIPPPLSPSNGADPYAGASVPY
jgi:type IV secretion system protein VirB2